MGSSRQQSRFRPADPSNLGCCWLGCSACLPATSGAGALHCSSVAPISTQHSVTRSGQRTQSVTDGTCWWLPTNQSLSCLAGAPATEATCVSFLRCSLVWFSPFFNSSPISSTSQRSLSSVHPTHDATRIHPAFTSHRLPPLSSSCGLSPKEDDFTSSHEIKGACLPSGVTALRTFQGMRQFALHPTSAPAASCSFRHLRFASSFHSTQFSTPARILLPPVALKSSLTFPSIIPTSQTY